jgi:hypothetical protein
MRTLLCAITALLLGGGSCLAQVSTMGTTAMGLSTTPGAIVSSPLTAPGPFSAATVSGAPDTTLAPVPLAQDPTTSGTSVNCSPSAVQATSPSLMSVTGSNVAPITTGTGFSTSLAPALPVTISASASRSATGTLTPAAPLGSSIPGGSCTLAPGTTLTNAAALPLSTPGIPANPPPGTVQSPVADLGGTSISPTMTVIPTPNSAACSENISMDLANPGMMAPANATGATATPGVSPPSGC